MKFLFSLGLLATGAYAAGNNLRTTTSRNLAKPTKCLMANMSASNGYEGDVKGTVKVCFNDPLESYLTPKVATATMEMKVEGLPTTIAGGVHIHSGTSCADSGSQLGHYWNSALAPLGPKEDGDAWFMEASALAPTGTGYITDDDGEGEAKFFVNNGYGFDDNEGKVVVVHGETKLTGGSYARIACGVLVEDQV